MVITFNNRFGKKLIYFQIIYNLIIKFCISVLGFPSFLNYLTDIVTLLLFFCVWKKFRKTFNYIKYKDCKFVLALFTFIVILSAIFNLTSPFLFLWAFRNTFRFFAFFIACVVVLESDDIEKIFNILLRFQILNVLACAYEYLILRKNQDYLGGIFGIDQGCNGALNLYFCIILIWTMSQFIAKKKNVVQLGFVLGSTLLIASMAELKIFYVEVIIIIGAVIILSKPSFRSVTIVGFAIIAFIYSINLLRQLFPHQYAVLANMNDFFSYFNSSGTGGYNISRMSAFSEINERFFHGNVFYNLLGLGFGSCEYSSFSLFTSPFYKNYSNLNYRFFAHATIFLETGFLGMFSYLLFFVDVAVNSLIKTYKYTLNRSYMVSVVVFAGICLINTWYNYALKIEYAYMAFFVLAISAIDLKCKIMESKNV